jgi:hypothetical protein
MDPTDLTGELAMGDLQNTADGPYVGVSDGNDGAATTYLATGFDLDQLAIPVAIAPQRYLDTRSSAGRARVVRTSPSPYDSTGRLKAGSWLDVSVGNTSADPWIQAVFVNATVTLPVSGGYLQLYPPGARPASSTLNFSAGQTIANGAFVATALYGDHYTVRVYASATTHAVVDVTGVTVLGPSAVPVGQQAAMAKEADGRSPARRIVRAGTQGTR